MKNKKLKIKESETAVLDKIKPLEYEKLNQETINAIMESEKQLKHPEWGTTDFDEFWRDLCE